MNNLLSKLNLNDPMMNNLINKLNLNLNEAMNTIEENIFLEIQEHHRPTTEEKYDEVVMDVFHEEIDHFVSRCGWMFAKDAVEKFGVFQALEAHGYLDALMKNCNEEDFWKYLLAAILDIDDLRERLGYKEYQMWNERFPLKESDDE